MPGPLLTPLTPLVLALVLTACTSLPPGTRVPEPRERRAPEPTPPVQVEPSPPPASSPPSAPPAPPLTAPPTPAPPAAAPRPAAQLRPASYRDLPGWQQDDPSQAWPALLQSCRVLRTQPAWSVPCQAAEALGQPDAATARAYFERHFVPHQVLQPDGSPEGLVTGYYEPLLRGSRSPSARYRHPLYAPPEDLLVIDLGTLYPELRNLRLRGRLEGRRVVPYYTRAEIETGAAPVRGRELLWVDDPVELFFLQVQGSGRVLLDNGEVVRVGYAEQNGHPYRSIGRWLVDNGELPLERASMQGIKEWAQRNPHRLTELLHANPSYVFFRELPKELTGPLGALGVPLTAERSIAVDPSMIPLGVPVWLATTRPNSNVPLERLVLAQDTGGAIRGAVRADFFWGFGEAAGQLAGAMKQRGRMWVLLPPELATARTAEPTSATRSARNGN
ncbi:MAG: murein transglycosylase A [Burkholderiales bacterium]|nr:murein transglycosylase A [Burkholderiales bacterium]